MTDKTLASAFEGDELEMMQQDLEQAANLIDSWLEGGVVDPDLLGYRTYLFEILAERCPHIAAEKHSH